MQRRFGVVIGLSDHTLENATAIASVGLGCSLVEKHFTLDRTIGGPDDSFSLEPKELAALCKGMRTAWEALGKVSYGPQSSDQGHVQYRRSLYFVRPLEAGQVVTVDAVRSVRPGHGVAPKYLDKILGKRARWNIQANTPVSFESVE